MQKTDFLLSFQNEVAIVIFQSLCVKRDFREVDGEEVE